MEEFKEIIKRYFGEDSWDYNHTLAAVYWMEKLIEKEGGDKRILIPAIYLHDIGYGKDIKSLQERISRKKIHMEEGAKEAEKILSKIGFSEDEIKEITHLIRIHDNFKELKTKNDFLIFEADSHPQIDSERVTPSFTKEEYKNYLNYFKKERLPRFKTATGKNYVEKLFADAISKIAE